MSYPPPTGVPPILPNGAAGAGIPGQQLAAPLTGFPPPIHGQFAYAVPPMNLMNPLLNLSQINIMPQAGLPPSSAINSKNNFNKLNSISSSPNMNNPNSEQKDRPPVTTVFIGNISEKAPDSMIRAMLNKCGSVINWKRVQGTNGKLQAFGFCEYDSPDSTLRCIRLLNNYQIVDKKLLVKVDQKTKELLAEYIKSRRASDKTPLTKNAKKAAAMRSYSSSGARPDEEEETAPAAPAVINLELVDEDTLKEDRSVIHAFESILAQFARDLEREPADELSGSETPPPGRDEARREADTERAANSSAASGTDDDDDSRSGEIHMKSHLRLEQCAVDEDKKEYITSEIATFREKHRGEDTKIRQEERERIQRIERERLERLERERERTREREKERQERQERERNARERSKEREKEQRERDRGDRDNKTSGGNSSKSSRDAPSDAKSKRDASPPSSSRYGNGKGGRGPSPSRKPGYNSRSRSPESSRRPRGASPSRNGGGGGDRHKENRPAPMNPQEDPEEYRERLRLERRLREKEQAYSERLRAWEDREEKRRAEYEIEKKEERQRKALMNKDAKKLRQFLEDYDDDKDDPVYYKGSSLEKKLKLREKEIESDNRDRRREKEELEELKKKLLEKGSSAADDLDQEVRKLAAEESQKLKSKFEKLDESSSSSSEDEEADEPAVPASETKPMEVEEPASASTNAVPVGEEVKSGLKSNGNVADVSTGHMDDSTNEDSVGNPFKTNDDSSDSPMMNNNNSPSSQLPSSTDAKANDSMSSPGSNSPMFGGFSLNNAQPVTIKKTSITFKKSIKPINQAFAADDDDDAGGSSSKRSKLSTQIPSSSELEERKRAVKKLVESIPTGKAELFAFKIDWNQLDTGLMEKRIKPWINKKIVEYIGEEEATLHDFFCTKIQQHTSPEKFLEETKVILDEEAEMFVIKMWRLLIYETESKRCGLSK